MQQSHLTETVKNDLILNMTPETSPEQNISIYIYICIYIYIYIYTYTLYKKNRPKIKKRRYMKYFGYILTFINHTVH